MMIALLLAALVLSSVFGDLFSGLYWSVASRLGNKL